MISQNKIFANSFQTTPHGNDDAKFHNFYFRDRAKKAKSVKIWLLKNFPVYSTCIALSPTLSLNVILFSFSSFLNWLSLSLSLSLSLPPFSTPTVCRFPW